MRPAPLCRLVPQPGLLTSIYRRKPGLPTRSVHSKNCKINKPSLMRPSVYPLLLWRCICVLARISSRCFLAMSHQHGVSWSDLRAARAQVCFRVAHAARKSDQLIPCWCDITRKQRDEVLAKTQMQRHNKVGSTLWRISEGLSILQFFEWTERVGNPGLRR